MARAKNVGARRCGKKNTGIRRVPKKSDMCPKCKGRGNIRKRKRNRKRTTKPRPHYWREFFKRCSDISKQSQFDLSQPEIMVRAKECWKCLKLSPNDMRTFRATVDKKFGRCTPRTPPEPSSSGCNGTSIIKPRMKYVNGGPFP